MMYKDELADFAERTLVNLENIRRFEREQELSGIGVKDRSIYPVTQLVNSLLGLIVFPKENYRQHIPKKNFAKLLEEGWPNLEVSYPNPICTATRRRASCLDDSCLCIDHQLGRRQQAKCQRNHRRCETLAELIRVLRNGISHFNIKFISGFDSHEIDLIEVSNRCNCCEEITTTVRLDLEQIRDIAERYARLMITHAGREHVQVMT